MPSGDFETPNSEFIVLIKESRVLTGLDVQRRAADSVSLKHALCNVFPETEMRWHKLPPILAVPLLGAACILYESRQGLRT